VGKPNLASFHDGFSTLPQGLRLLFFLGGRRKIAHEEKSKKADKVNIITTKLPL
jgi:hypothetical protein